MFLTQVPKARGQSLGCHDWLFLIIPSERALPRCSAEDKIDNKPCAGWLASRMLMCGAQSRARAFRLKLALNDSLGLLRLDYISAPRGSGVQT